MKYDTERLKPKPLIMREAFNRKSTEGILHLQALIKTLFNLIFILFGKIQSKGWPISSYAYVDYDCEFEKIKVANISDM